MACAHPLSYCPSVSVRGKIYSWKEYVDVPCGWCVNCRRDLQNYWIDRANYEYCKRLTGSFVTFTYDNIWLLDRCSVYGSHGLMYDDGEPRFTLNYDDLTKFIDSIRHYILEHPEIQNTFCQPDFSYLYCGEYGDDFGRPHYHVLFFGLDFAYCKKIIFERWKYGFIDVLPILDGGIRYVCKYMDKFEKGELAFYKYDVKGLARPKLRASVGFGQGLLWDNFDDIYANYFTYPVQKFKRRPISAYWKYLITGSCVSRDPTKKAWNEYSDDYKAYKIICTAERMIQAGLSKRKNIYSKVDQSEFKRRQAKIREHSLITQYHNNHIPVPDELQCRSNRYGWTTYNREKIRKLPTAKQLLLADEYRHTLEERYLYLHFPDVS